MDSTNEQIAKLVEERSQRFDALSRAPSIEITGLLKPSNFVGTVLRGEERVELSAALAAWRIDQESIRTENLELIFRGSDAEVNAIRLELGLGDSIVLLRARYIASDSSGADAALLQEVLSVNVSDPELEVIRNELRKPVVYLDDELGDFILDTRVDWFRGRMPWGEIDVRLELSATTQEKAAAAALTAKSLLSEQSSWDDAIKRRAAEDLLDLWNTTWRRWYQPKLGSRAFTEKLVLESVEASDDGCFEFEYDDGGLFRGHTVLVCGNLSDGVTRAGLHG